MDQDKVAISTHTQISTFCNNFAYVHLTEMDKKSLVFIKIPKGLLDEHTQCFKAL